MNSRIDTNAFAKLRQRLHLLCILNSVMVAIANGQSPTDPPVVGGGRMQIDRTSFVRLAGPNTDDTPGSLSAVGSFYRGAQCVRDAFQSEGSADSGVWVEVVSFPKEYAYVGHDAFGALLMTAAYDDEKRSGPWDLLLAVTKVLCLPWKFADGKKGGSVCYVHRPATEIGPVGTVQWVAGTPKDGLVSVGIGYRNMTGLPGQVIDEYLRKYPSTLPTDPTWHHDWEHKDLLKWADILANNKEDRVMLHTGAAHLRRYDKLSFGLLGALSQSSNTASGSQALDEVIARLEQAAAERKSQAPQPPPKPADK